MQLETTQPVMESMKIDESSHAAVPFHILLEKYDYEVPHRGEYLEGEIIKIGEDAIFVDVGAKRDAIVPYDELGELGETFIDSLSRGDAVPVYVLNTPRGDHELLVSLEKGLALRDWETAVQHKENSDMLELPVLGYNKGGVLVGLGRLEGFVPNSHIPSIQYIHDSRQRSSAKSKMVDNTLPVKIIEIDQARERLVLSGTAAQEEYRRQKMNELQAGSIVTGRVVSLVKFGAFVEFDGITGLLHISNMDWATINHPSEVFSKGDEVEVRIDKVDLKKEHIHLNRKALLPNPWELFPQRYSEGDLVSGVVQETVDYGAFVEMPSGIRGLVHISEMNVPRDSNVSDVYSSGDEVLVRILDIKPEEERLSLSIRRVGMEAELLWMADNE